MTFTTTDWLEVRKRAAKLCSMPPESEETRAYLWSLLPSTLPYYSRLNPAFIVSLSSTAALNRAPHWLVRDGAVPLLHFFGRNPAPGSFKGALFVHRSAAAIVPRSWQRSVALYEVVTRYLPPRLQSPRRLIVCGQATPCFHTAKPKKQFRADLQRELASAAKGAEEVACFVPRQYLAWEVEKPGERDWGSDVLMICQRSARRAHAIKSDEFHDRSSSLHDWRVLELNERLLIADSFILHSFLRRGAILEQPRGAKPLEGARYVPLSPFHGMEIAPFRAPTDNGFARDAAGLLRMRTKQAYPWSRPGAS